MSTPPFLAMCALVLVTPFEMRYPVIVLPYQEFKLTELVWLAAAACWAVSYAIRQRSLLWRTPVTAPLVMWIAAMAVAAITADVERANAVKNTAKLIVFGVTGLMVAISVSNARRMAVLLAIAAASGIVVAILAILEVQRVQAVVIGLDAFRDGVRAVGGYTRASSTMQYPTITAMYLELVLCGAVGILLWAGDRRGWFLAPVTFTGLLVVIAGLTLTLTRAAVLAALGGIMFAAWLRYRQRGSDRGFVLVAACALCLISAPVLLASTEVLLARLSTDGSQGWYRAAFDAPRLITGRPGELVNVPITVTNQGRIKWSSSAIPPFYVSYHWVDESTTRVVAFDGLRTPLTADLSPGSRLDLSAQVRFPDAPGSYRLAWDVVLEGRLWFVGEPGAQTTFSGAVVTGAATTHASAESLKSRPSPARPSPDVLPVGRPNPGRPALWSAALRMAADHPWLGVGPDNFRLLSARYLGDVDHDPSVHSNNMYLEVLTGGGVFSLAAFLWFLWRAAAVIRTQWKRLSGQAAAVYTGVAAAGLAYLAHGLLDSFLTFTPTVFASALILGLAIAPIQWTET